MNIELEKTKGNLELVLKNLDGLPQALKDSNLNIESEIISLCEAKIETILSKIEDKIESEKPITLTQHLESKWELETGR